MLFQTNLLSSLNSFRKCMLLPLSLAAVLFLSGCTNQGANQNLASSMTSIPPSQGVVVIGLKGNAAGTFRRGVYSDEGSFEHDTARDAAFSAPSSEPYIVQAMNITSDKSRYGMYQATLGGREYSFKCGQVLPVISVASNAAQYYGDFEVTISSGRLTVKQSFDLERAQSYIDSAYPLSGWKLEPGKVVRARSTNCVSVPPAAIVG